MKNGRFPKELKQKELSEMSPHGHAVPAIEPGSQRTLDSATRSGPNGGEQERQSDAIVPAENTQRRDHMDREHIEQNVGTAAFLIMMHFSQVGCEVDGKGRCTCRFADPEGKAAEAADAFSRGELTLPKPMSFSQWLQETERLVAQGMDYSKADGKELISAGMWARKELDRLCEEIQMVSSHMRNPQFGKTPEWANLSLEFFAEVFRLVPCFLAVIRTTTKEIVTRVNKNKVNRHFGMLILACKANDNDSWNKERESLLELAVGIAGNNSLYDSNSPDWWILPTDQALQEQVKRFSDLDVTAIWEHMIDSRFGVVGNAIKNRLIDHVKRLTRKPDTVRLDDPNNKFVLEIPDPAPNPEERLLAQSRIKAFESPDGDVSEMERVFWAAIGSFLKAPAELLGMTDPQVRAELVKRAAAIRDVTVRQAWNDLKNFLEDKEAWERTATMLREN